MGKSIRLTTEIEVAKSYLVKGTLQSTSHTRLLMATRASDGHQVVVKKRDKQGYFKNNGEDQDWRQSMERQLNLPRHETICQTFEVLETEQCYYVVMEHATGRDVFEHVLGLEGSIQEADAREIIRQVLDGLQFMHNFGRIHGDIKLENVMVDFHPGRASVKLIDFDASKHWAPSVSRASIVLGTDGFISPEAYDGKFSPASDIYSVGIVMFRLLTEQLPTRPEIFDDLPGENWVGSPAMKRIRDRLLTEQVDFSRLGRCACQEAVDLCSRMLCNDAESRPSASEALQHAWFQACTWQNRTIA
eukprot:CAMPEP_0172666554 /NCGR_PEP_ID=MMETSP1074-20121228/7862_1 /TAXON_ID=2916 /ORGANISM="Ceratium fusus, Strain PA161109" /LENGTH=302 /DNA_ID=CAMNT_0013482937 /DNA_START=210 /DNA_END=1118 /DNA_ORIENTATION=+